MCLFVVRSVGVALIGPNLHNCLRTEGGKGREIAKEGERGRERDGENGRVETNIASGCVCV